MRVDKLTAAAHVFEKSRGVELSSYNLDLIEICGFTNKCPKELSCEIVSFLEKGHILEGNVRATAYWALGKKNDRGLVGFFIRKLEYELNVDIRIAYQIMIALDDLGEPVFGDDREGSYSYDEDELNRKDCIAYLAKLGKV